MKTCWKCKTCKPDAEFWKDKRSADGLQKACSACQKIASKAFRERHPDYFKTKGKQRYWQIGKGRNAERYSAAKEDFKRRRAAISMTARGRLMGLLTAARTRAKQCGMEFSIDLDFVLDQWDRQQGRCLLTGLPLTLERNPGGQRFYMPHSPSLDRRDSSAGYTPDNTRLVCVVVNLALNRFGDAVLDQMCRAYVANNKEPPP